MNEFIVINKRGATVYCDDAYFNISIDRNMHFHGVSVNIDYVFRFYVISKSIFDRLNLSEMECYTFGNKAGIKKERYE